MIFSFLNKHKVIKTQRELKKRFLILCAFVSLCSFLFSSLNAITLDEKIGRKIIVGFRGLDVDENSPIVQQIKKGQVGGVILFDYDPILKTPRNIESPAQLKALCQKLQSYSKFPLIIACDQEGGIVRRLKPEYGFPITPSAAEMSNKSTQEVYELGKLTGSYLKEAGINLNFAPVADLNINEDNPSIAKKDRSFGKDPLEVAKYLIAFCQGQKDSQVLSTLKHFPGIGSASSDTHKGFVDITNTWSEQELIPYQELISSNYCDLIMTGHVFNKNLDPQYPASLSKKIVTDLLRNTLKFKGLIITDDLQMAAIRNFYTLEESVQLALDAGVDYLLFANTEIYDEEIAPKAIQAYTSWTTANQGYAPWTAAKGRNPLQTQSQASPD